MNNFENLKINDLSIETEEGYYKIVEQLEEQPLDLNKLPDDFRDSDPNFDPKLVDLLKENESIKIPSRLDKSVMANYHQQIKLQNSFLGRTLFRNLFRNKQFIKRIAKSKGMKNAFIELIRINLTPTLRPILAGALLFILTTIAYYQYTKPQSNPTNIIANQETPAIKVIPSTTNTPIDTPSPIQTINPDIAKSPENNDDNIRQGDTKENNQQAKTNENRKPRKPEEPKDLDKENDKIAMSTKPKDNTQEGNIRGISKKRGNSINRNNSDVKNERLTLSNLVYVAVKDLKMDKQELNIIDIEIKDELIKAINDNGKWELSSEQDDKTQAIFYKQSADGALVLFDKKERTPLWEDLNYIENYKKDKNYIKSIVKMLENHKDESPQEK